MQVDTDIAGSRGGGSQQNGTQQQQKRPFHGRLLLSKITSAYLYNSAKY
jgi:hypothetical protein